MLPSCGLPRKIPIRDAQPPGRGPGTKGGAHGPRLPAQPPALRSRTLARGRASLTTQSQGSAAPFIPAGTCRRAPAAHPASGKAENPVAPEPASSDPHRSPLACARAPVRAVRPQVTWTPEKPSPYPPATGVRAPRAARAARGHCQLRAVETGVDSEEEGAELQPRGHGRTLAQSGWSPLSCCLQLAL